MRSQHDDQVLVAKQMQSKLENTHIKPTNLLVVTLFLKILSAA